MINKKNKNLIIGLILCFIVISCLIINCKYRENYNNLFDKGICPKKPKITKVIKREEELECSDIINFQTTDKEVIDAVKELIFEGLLKNKPVDFCKNIESNLNKIKEGTNIDSLDVSENDKNFLKKIVSESFIEKLNDPNKFKCIKTELEDICIKLSDESTSRTVLINNLFNSNCFITTLTLTLIESNAINSTPSTEPEKKDLKEKIIKTLSSIVAKDNGTIIELSKGITKIENKQINNQFKTKSAPLLMDTVIEETETTKDLKEKILNAKFIDNTPGVRAKLQISDEGQKILDTCKANELV
tara:strand:+ start:206 stop:1111 length:906 start_codon:yes stop_codon:yes gene_type:complete